MSKRAIVIGLVIASLVGAIGFFNDMVMKQTFLFSSYLPVFVFGSLCLFVIAFNPMLRRIWHRLAFSGKELALIVAIVLPAVYVGGRGFIHHFSHSLMSPHFHNRTMLAWQKRELLRRLPSVMLAGVEPEYMEQDIKDPAALAALVNGAQADNALAVKVKTALGGAIPTAAPEARKALNRLLKEPEIFADADFAEAPLPVWARQMQESGPKTEEEWRRLNRHRLDVVLGENVVSLEAREEFAINGFRAGIREGSAPISVSDIPWYAWKRTLTRFWFPLIFTIVIAYISLALVFKRQWAEHEHIPFPIVSFAKSLLPNEDGSMNSIFRKPAFWIGAGLVTAIHLNNYVVTWWPEYLIRFPVRFNFGALGDLMPVFVKGGGRSLLYPTFFFTVIGFAFFVASDVALSLGIAPFIYCLVAGVFVGYGIDLNGGGDYNSIRISNFIKAGSYFGMFLITIYVGRQFYLSVLRRAFGLKADDDVRTHEVWGARIAMLAALVFILQLCFVGVAWHWAVFHTLCVCMTFVVVSRMVGETGMFLFHPMIIPAVVLWGFVGPRALGGQQIFLLMIIGVMMDMPTQVSAMPMMVHGLKLTDEKPGRTSMLAGAGVILAIIIGVSASLYFQYDRGAAAVTDNWSDGRVSKAGFNPVVTAEYEMEAQGVLNEEGVGFFKRLGPKGPQILTFLIAMGLVLLFEFCRLRISKWPLHPVMFLVSGFWHAKALAASFLLGWVIRLLATKYGGANSYNRLKPLMIGFVTGELLAGVIAIIFSFLYYFYTGEQPVRFAVFPG